MADENKKKPVSSQTERPAPITPSSSGEVIKKSEDLIRPRPLPSSSEGERIINWIPGKPRKS